ncbi:MAG: glycine zipper 2TM domain-containing protein [Sphingomonadaceae bacterium]
MRMTMTVASIATMVAPLLIASAPASAHGRYKTFRGADGRTYCRKSDGTVGAIVGAVGGGLLGNIIGGRGDKTITTLVGAGAGGLAGRAVERRRKVRCG